MMATHAEPGRFDLLEPVQPQKYPLWRNGRLWGQDEGIEWGLCVRQDGLHLMLASGQSLEGFQQCGTYSVALRLQLLYFSLYLRLRWPFPIRMTELFLLLETWRGLRQWRRWRALAYWERDLPYYL